MRRESIADLRRTRLQDLEHALKIGYGDIRWHDDGILLCHARNVLLDGVFRKEATGNDVAEDRIFCLGRLSDYNATL